MWEFIFNTLWGWWGVVGLIVAGAVAVAIIFPRSRTLAIAVAGAALLAAGIYTKGQRDRAALEQRRKDAAVKKVKDKYNAIDRRKDTPRSVSDRMRRGDF